MQNEEGFEYEIRDVVEWCGVRGTVIDKFTAGPDNKLLENEIRVNFETHGKYWFRSDGRQHGWHRESSLKLILRLKSHAGTEAHEEKSEEKNPT